MEDLNSMQTGGNTGAPAPLGTPSPEDKKGNKNMMIAIIIVVIIIIAAGIWLWKAAPSYTPSSTPAGTPVPTVPAEPSDTTGAINESLDELDLGDIDSEFQAIDQDLESL